MAKPMVSILIADDDVSIGSLLREIIVYLGYAVCALATSEDAAVAAAIMHRPDLIVMDANLRPGNGIDAIERIIAVIGPVPHVFISGSPHEVRSRMPRAITLQKPFRIEEIEMALNRALEPQEGRTCSAV